MLLYFFSFFFRFYFLRSSMCRRFFSFELRRLCSETFFFQLFVQLLTHVNALRIVHSFRLLFSAGGDGAAASSGALGNAGFGDPVDIALAGRRGGGSGEGGGGEGGGLIRIKSASVTINGKLTADGAEGPAGRGGGSGGGVRIEASGALDFKATSRISAKGGTSPDGPGGGGRVAVLYGNGTAIDVAQVVAVEGGAGTGENQRSGGLGTVYVKAGDAPSRLLVIGSLSDTSKLSPTPLVIANDTVGDLTLKNTVVRANDTDGENSVQWYINGTLTLEGAQIRARRITVVTGGSIVVDAKSVISVSASVSDASVGGGRNVSASDPSGSGGGGASHAGIGGRGAVGEKTAPGYGGGVQPTTFGSPGGAGLR
jgi:hypothetical protein